MVEGRFQSTPSPRRATLSAWGDPERLMVFQSTPSPRRATAPAIVTYRIYLISIHALPAEGDPQYHFEGAAPSKISIHALPAEGDLRHSVPKAAEQAFQSTPSPRRATPAALIFLIACSYFNPRPPRGGRHRPSLRMA